MGPNLLIVILIGWLGCSALAAVLLVFASFFPPRAERHLLKLADVALMVATATILLSFMALCLFMIVYFFGRASVELLSMVTHTEVEAILVSFGSDTVDVRWASSDGIEITRTLEASFSHSHSHKHPEPNNFNGLYRGDLVTLQVSFDGKSVRRAAPASIYPHAIWFGGIPALLLPRIWRRFQHEMGRI